MKVFQCPKCKGFVPLPERYSELILCEECNAANEAWYKRNKNPDAPDDLFRRGNHVLMENGLECLVSVITPEYHKELKYSVR